MPVVKILQRSLPKASCNQELHAGPSFKSSFVSKAIKNFVSYQLSYHINRFHFSDTTTVNKVNF